MTAFYDWLGLTKYGEVTIKRVSHSELLGDWNDVNTFTISNKNAWLWGTNKNVAVLAAVYINACVRVE